MNSCKKCFIRCDDTEVTKLCSDCYFKFTMLYIKSLKVKSVKDDAVNTDPIEKDEALEGKNVKDVAVNTDPIEKYEALEGKNVKDVAVNTDPIKKDEALEDKNVKNIAVNTDPIEKDEALEDKNVKDIALNTDPIEKDEALKNKENGTEKHGLFEYGIIQSTSFQNETQKILAALKSHIIANQRRKDIELQTLIDARTNFFMSNLDKQRAMIEKLNEEMCTLKKEYDLLKPTILDLKTRVDWLDQYNRRNCIEIYGIPVQKREEPLESLIKIAKLIGVKVRKVDVVMCYRLETIPNGIPALVARFTIREIAETLMKAKRDKYELIANYFNGNERVIYFQWAITKQRKSALILARLAKEDNQLHYVSVDPKGRIKIQKTREDDFVTVTSLEEVQELLKTKTIDCEGDKKQLDTDAE